MSEVACYQCQTSLDPTAAQCPKCGLPQILRGRYRIRRLLGQGGFGVVYEAVDLDLNRQYAIKLITATSPAIREQVAIEAQILAQHARRLPFMPEIYDIWSDTNRTALVMEYIDGATLGDLIDQHGAWPPNVVGRFLHTVLTDLSRLHGLGIIHRDIKPDNIKRAADGRYVLLDFGIAKRDNSTQMGAKAFSLYYASPEQSHGRATDARSDLYSLGATAYHMLTGHTPAPGASRLVMDAKLLPPIHFYPRTPAILNDLIVQLMELNPANRPASAQAALHLLKNKPPVNADPASAPSVVHANEPDAVIARQPAPFSSAGMATRAVSPPAVPGAPAAPAPPTEIFAPKRRPRWLMWLLAGMVVAALGGGAVFALSGRNQAVVVIPPTVTLQVAIIPTSTQAIAAVQASPSPTVQPTASPTSVPATAQSTATPTLLAPTAAPTQLPLVPPTVVPVPTTVIPPTAVPVPTSIPLAADLVAVVDLVNEQRTLRGLTQLVINPQLVSAAQRHSDDMATNNFFADTGSDGSDIQTRIKRTGYLPSVWIENIAAGYTAPFDVVKSWTDNPNNFINLLNPDVRDVGIGFAANPNAQFGRYWTIVFAKP